MAYATTSDIETLLGRTLTTEETDKVTAQLAEVSALIDMEAPCLFSAPTEVTETIGGVWGPLLPLTGPVTAVASVVDNDGLVYDIDRLTVLKDGLHLGDGGFGFGHWSAASPNAAGSWGGPSRSFTVTYTRGFAAVPEPVKGIATSAVLRAFSAPIGVRQQTTGPFSVTYAGEISEIGTVGLTANDRRTLHKLCRKELR